MLTTYCHISSQQGRVPTHMSGNEGGMGGVGPSQTQMRFSPGQFMTCQKMLDNNQNWNKILSKYGQKACPNLTMHLKVFFAQLRHAHCKPNYLEEETIRI